MEGLGCLAATAGNLGVLSVVVRGISDLMERDAETDALGSHNAAAEHARAFAIQVLSKLYPVAQPEKSRGFVRDTHIDSLISSVRFGELKTASQPALEILRSTDGEGRNEQFEKLLSYQDC